jgi:hypothetical protein
MMKLMKCPGVPGIKDEVISRTLEYWINFLEEYEDHEHDISEHALGSMFHSSAMATIRTLLKSLVRKLIAPNPFDWVCIEPDERAGFSDFRSESRDILESCFRIIGDHMVRDLAEDISLEVPRGRWPRVEVDLFCLTVLQVGDKEEFDNFLTLYIFDGVFLKELMDSEHHMPRTHRTAIRFLADYTGYLNRNPVYVPGVLNFLFTMLRDHEVAEDAAKAAYQVCYHCRVYLQNELPSFEQHFDNLAGYWDSAPEEIVPRIAGGIAAVIQSLHPPSAVSHGLDRLLSLVENGMQAAMLQLQGGDDVLARSTCLIVMACISSIAKSMKEPVEEDLINPQALNNPQPTIHGTFDSGKARVLNIMNWAVGMLPNDGSLMEEVCDIFKHGFFEPDTAPFHLPHESVRLFFTSTHIATARLEVVLGMICTYLSRYDKHRAPNDAATDQVNETATSILTHLCTLIKELGFPGQDPDIAHSLIDVLRRFIGNRAPILLGLSPSTAVESVFQFTIQCISLPEPLPKRAAIDFWVSKTCLFDFKQAL